MATPSWPELAIATGLAIGGGIALVSVTYRWTLSADEAWIVGGLAITATIWFLLLRRAMWSPRTIFGPRAIYPAVYAALFTMGTWNITERGGQLDPSILKYFGLGLAFYYIGGVLFDVVVLSRPRTGAGVSEGHSLSGGNPMLRRCAAGLVIGGLGCLVLAWISVGGIPIFDESLRLGLNSYLVALAQSSWVGLLIAGVMFNVMTRGARIRFVLLTLLVVGMLAVGGYRAPIVLGGLTAMIAVCLSSRRIHLRYLMLTGSFLLIASTAIPLVRDSCKYGYYSVRSTYIHQGIPESLVLFGPTYAVAREGPLIFSSLRDEMRGASLGGRLLLSDWISMLPGKQDNSRVIVRNLIRNPTDTSKTPSVVGTLYVDFGILGICVGMLVLSLCIHALYERWQSNGSVFSLLMYALTLAYGLISIHTGGYFEPVYVLSCLFIALVPRVARMIELPSRSRVASEERSG